MMKHYRCGRDADGTPRSYVEDEGCRHPLRQLAGPAPSTSAGVGDGLGVDDMARAILCDYLGQPTEAALCQAFARRFFGPTDRQPPWIVSGVEIVAWLATGRVLRLDELAVDGRGSVSLAGHRA